MPRTAAEVFIGWDPVDALAAEVCASSIRRRTKRPVRFIRQSDPDVRAVYKRPHRVEGKQHIDLGYRAKETPFSTEFSFTRFLVPYLAGYRGWAVFCDPDMLFTRSLDELFALADPQYAVMVVKHIQTPRTDLKMHGVRQTVYPRKNWSSLVLWNCDHPANDLLEPSVVNKFPGEFLHGFRWLEERHIGALPVEWNWLVGCMQEGEDDAMAPPAGIHWTLGGPWLADYAVAPWHDLWVAEAQDYVPGAPR